MKKPRRIISIITSLLSVTILVEVIIIIGILYYGKVNQNINNDAYGNFKRSVETSKLSIENQFLSKWAELYFDYEEITNFMNQYFGNLDNVKTVSTVSQQDFLNQTLDKIIAMMKRTQANGAFIILENNLENGDNELAREGIYLVNQSVNGEETIKIAIGSNSLLSTTEVLPIDNRNERFTFSNKPDEEYYYDIINITKNNEFSNMEYRHFSVLYQEYLNKDVINLAIPVFDNNLKSVAIIGIDLALDSLLPFLVIDEVDDLSCSLVLGNLSNDNNKITPIITTGNFFDKYLSKEETLSIKKKPDYEFCFLEKLKGGIGYLMPLILTSDNNLYDSEQWVIGRIAFKNDIIKPSIYIQNLVFLIILITLLFGFMVTYFLINQLGKPIINLSKQVKDSTSRKPLILEHSKILELNELINSIEELSYDVSQYSSKITNAIDKFFLGIFFYKEEDSNVFCTQPFLNICGVDRKEGYFDKEEFTLIFDNILKSRYDERLDVYQVSPEKWVKVDTITENNFTLGIVTDVSEQINEIRRVEAERDIDPLTKLYNRDAFANIVQEIIDMNLGKSIAVIMWDIDKLKYINDTYGHDIGDQYICKFADTIRFLEEYEGIVSRRSGDEFLGFIYGDNKADIMRIINELRQKINSTGIQVNDYIFEKLRYSTGVAWYPDDGNDLTTLINYADLALYESKFNYQDITNYYHNHNYNNNVLMHYNQELLKIIDGNYITFAYQPIVNAKDGTVFGYEFLMRIFSDIINSPQRLIALAKSNSKLERIEEMTFIKGFEAYQSNIDSFDKTKIFLNSISNTHLVDRALKEISKITDNNFEMLVVEFTEILNAKAGIIHQKINLFRSLNAEIALDNYGVETKKNIDIDSFQFDYIKIDKTIVDEIHIDEEKQNIFNELKEYAQTNNVKLIAVGIKNHEEMEYLIKNDVDYLQGYYLGMPAAKPSGINPKISATIVKLNKK